LLLLVFALEIVTTVRQESLTWDEGDHIFAGYMSWKTHDYGLNPEHPPLVKMLATIPLLDLPLRVPPDQHRFFKGEAYMDGRDMLFGNGPEYSAETLTFRVRMFAGVLALLLALFVFLAAREMFGLGAGFLSLAMLVFEPNVIAHSALVTTDVAVSCFLLATVYAFYRYAKRPSLTRLVVAGLAAGLALASKHSAVLLVPMLMLLAVCEVAFRFPERGEERETQAHRALRMVSALIAVAAIGVVVLWAFYGFRYDARPAGVVLTPTLAEYVSPLRATEAKGILFLARMRVLPESYLYGLTDVRAMANGMPSFFLGKVYLHGVWFYFPAVLGIKSTIGFLGLVLAAGAACIAGRVRRRREILFVVVPAGVYLWTAMTSNLNIGARHILPVYIFLCVFVGASWEWTRRRGGAYSRVGIGVVAVLLAAHVVSSAKAYPYYMAYSNEMWGGPEDTYKYLTDSNTDWAQQLIEVRQYLERRGVKECWFVYFAQPLIDFKGYGIPCRPLPAFDSISVDAVYDVPPIIRGPVLISAGDLTGFEFGSNVLNPYRAFQAVKPSGMIGYGVLVYDGEFAVPLASAYAHVQRSGALLKEKKVQAALDEAQQSVSLAPEAVQTQVALGEALKAAGRGDDARAAYGRALAVVATMEAGARESWTERVQKKMQ
jgi:4-amino-4-deoxy-L-arabinose transferase-like glycosyltransferase